MEYRKIVSENQTVAMAKELGRLLKSGDIVCLAGDLGAGKTTFTKALGSALGVKEAITSPTFSLIHEYSGIVPVFHFDVYRLVRPSEFRDLGAEEYFGKEGICIIEWANLVREYLPENTIWIEINWVDAEHREICISGNGDSAERVIKELDIN